jgi:hypothetical protein
MQTAYGCTGFKEATLQSLIDALAGDKFDPYLTSVGGSGLGILSPYSQRLAVASGPVTPPETPNGQGKPTTDVDPPEPLRTSFEATNMSELAGWADTLGRWLFV